MTDIIMTAYAWGFGNIGDAAITPGLVRLLQGRFPEHTVAVLAEAGEDRVREYVHRVAPGALVLANALAQPFEVALAEAKRHRDLDFAERPRSLMPFHFKHVLRGSHESVINHKHTVPFAMFCHFHVSELFVPNRSSRTYFASLRQATQMHSKSTIDN